MEDFIIKQIDKIDNALMNISEKLSNQNGNVAVIEQKIREINHKISDGQQRNILSHDLLKVKLEKIEEDLKNKASEEDCILRQKEIQDAIFKDRKILYIVAFIVMAGSGVTANSQFIKEFIKHIFGG